MKEFMAVYVGSPQANEQSGWNSLSDAERTKREREGMQAWMKWGEDHAASIVVNGGPLGKTKFTSKDGVKDITNNIAGFIIVRAESHEAAAKMFLNHPHFAIFPGSGVEIMECTPIPTMP